MSHFEINSGEDMRRNFSAFRYLEFARQNFPRFLPQGKQDGGIPCFLSISGGGYDIMYYVEMSKTRHPGSGKSILLELHAIDIAISRPCGIGLIRRMPMQEGYPDVESLLDHEASGMLDVLIGVVFTDLNSRKADQELLAAMADKFPARRVFVDLLDNYWSGNELEEAEASRPGMTG